MKTRKCEINVQFGVMSFQQASDIGVNSFAVQLLAESLGDKDILLEGGILFLFPHDHKGRPVWITVSGEAPVIGEVQEVEEAAGGQSHSTSAAEQLALLQKQTDRQLEAAEKALRLCATRAGAPDASAACREVIATVEQALAVIDGQRGAK